MKTAQHTQCSKARYKRRKKYPKYYLKITKSLLPFDKKCSVGTKFNDASNYYSIAVDQNPMGRVRRVLSQAGEQLLSSEIILSEEKYVILSETKRKTERQRGTQQKQPIILIITITELLVDNASVPAGGPFLVLLPAGGPFITSPLVDTASVTAGGPFIFYSFFFMYHAACKVEFQPFNRSYSQLTFFNFL